VSVIAPPPPQDELELLIREARARQRKRWIGAAASIAVFAGAALGIYSLSAGRSAGPSSVGRARPAPTLARCRADQLRLSFVSEGVAGGSAGDGFTVTDISPESCTLRGWPTLTYTFLGGRTLRVHPREVARIFSSQARIHTVVLRPKRSASFHLWSADAAPATMCPTTTVVRVALPGAARWLSTPAAVPYCGSRWIMASAFQAGRAGRYVAGA
jgi:hypothetical protein